MIKIPNFKSKDLLGVTILLVLGAVFLYANYGDKLPIVRGFKLPTDFNFLKQTKPPAKVEEFKFPKTAIKSDLSYPAVQKVYSFLTEVYSEKSLPEKISLSLQKVGNKGEGDEYATGWKADENFLNVLYVTSLDPTTPTYLRAWYLPLAVRTLNKERGKELLGRVFNEKILSETKNLNCKDAKAENDLPVTVCDFMWATENGDKEGILIRTPLLTPNGTPSAVVAVCLYPKSSRLYQGSNYCL